MASVVLNFANMRRSDREAKKAEDRLTQKLPVHERHSKHPMVHAGEAGAIAGEVAGAVVGSAAGPVGTITGMILGGIAGTVAGNLMERESERAGAHDEELDRTIGVVGGDLGAARKDAPPARIGAPSSASSGAGSYGRTPAEGPIPEPEDNG
jgi:phage tail tape-measure protein